MASHASSADVPAFPFMTFLRPNLTIVEGWELIVRIRADFCLYVQAFAEKGVRDKSWVQVASLTALGDTIIDTHDAHLTAFGRPAEE